LTNLNTKLLNTTQITGTSISQLNFFSTYTQANHFHQAFAAPTSTGRSLSNPCLLLAEAITAPTAQM